MKWQHLEAKKIIPMADLGYEPKLCNMALVNAAASWDGFQGNVVRVVRENGLSFNKPQLCKQLKKLAATHAS